MLPRDLPQHLEPIHPRHVQIQRHHVRMQLFQLSQSHFAVHRRAHHFNRRIPLQHLRNQLPHQRRIIHHQHAYLFAHAGAHAVAPTAGIRARCDTTAGMFRISTIVPSPRIEAPLTNGEVTNWSSNALMTSSSSPISLSTANPNRRLPAPITTTKTRFDLSNVSEDSSRSRRTNVSTCCRS